MKKPLDLSYYAYNKELQNKGAQKSTSFNFSKISKGFYDELVNAQSDLKTSKKSIDEIKNTTIKQSVYSNQNLPSNWKTKIGYRNQVINMITSDNYLARYLANCPKESKELKEFMEKMTNTTKKKSNEPQLPDIKPASTSQIETSPNPGMRFSTKLTQSKIMNFMASSVFTSNMQQFMSDKLIESKLDDYRVKYDMKKFINNVKLKRENGEIEGNEKANEDNNNKNNNYIKEWRKKKEKNAKVLKESIYINLIPKEDEDKKSLTLPAYYPCIDSSDELKRKIEITNPKIKRDLELIDYYGPLNSHCRFCSNRNKDFYQNYETNQCFKLLGYLKKFRSQTKSRDFRPVHISKILTSQ